MNWKLLLAQHFNEVIDAKETVEDGMQILDITLSHSDLNHINDASIKINKFLDENANIERFDSIVIHSPGLIDDIDFASLSQFIGQDIEIFLQKNENGVNKYNALLLEDNDQSIKIKWNQKGNIRKIDVDKSNIIKIKRHFKF